MKDHIDINNNTTIKLTKLYKLTKNKKIKEKIKKNLIIHPKIEQNEIKITDNIS